MEEERDRDGAGHMGGAVGVAYTDSSKTAGRSHSSSTVVVSKFS